MSPNALLWLVVGLLIAMIAGLPIGSLAGAALLPVIAIAAISHTVGATSVRDRCIAAAGALFAVALLWPQATVQVRSAVASVGPLATSIHPSLSIPWTSMLGAALVIGTFWGLGHLALAQLKAGTQRFLHPAAEKPRKPRLRRDPELPPERTRVPEPEQAAFDLFGGGLGDDDDDA